MALRVLLADESTTIKKVMQLALQDFAVEVKNVHSGIDVIEVARAFQPDIIFADILLPKRNGYEVCADLKKDVQLRNIPVVLMWSAFMDLDEKAYLQIRADGKLEKPFDVETLRSLILELVPKTQSQRLAHFLRFPSSFIDPLKQEEAQKRQTHAQHVEHRPAGGSSAFLGGSGGSVHGPAPSMGTTAVKPPPEPTSVTPPPAPSLDAFTHLPPLHAKSTSSVPPQTPSSGSRPAESNWDMESFADIEDFSGDFSAKEAPPKAEQTVDRDIDFSIDLNEISDDDEPEPMRMTKLAGTSLHSMKSKAGTSGANSASSTAVAKADPRAKVSDKSAPHREETAAGDEEPWSHQDLSRFKLSLPETGGDEDDEVSLIFDIEQADKPVENSDFLLNRPTEKVAKVGKTIDATIDAAPASGPQTREERLRHVGEVRGADGEMISQFAHDEEEEGTGEPLSLVDEPPPKAPPAQRIPELSVQQLEEIIRAQSKDIIEALVRKIVPDIATKLIKEELERLTRENPDEGSR